MFTKFTAIALLGYLKMIPEDDLLKGVATLSRVLFDYLYGVSL